MNEIKKVACIGAGLIGQGWATIFSSNGLEVVLQDRNDHILVESLKQIRSNLLFLEAHNLLAPGQAKESLGRITTSTSVGAAVSTADYVQESVPENYEIKKAVFKEMDDAAPRRSILASSASGLLMTEIQNVTQVPDRCVMVHPLLPVHIIPAVEIAGGETTSLETIETARKFMENLGKIPVVLNHETPGYIVNRLQAAMLREAIDLVEKGVASAEDVDTVYCKGIGLRAAFLGPFLKMHLTGNGIEGFIQNYAKSYQYRWETMESWTSLSETAAKALTAGVRDMDIVRNNSLEETKLWRDEKLMEILKLT